MYLAIMLMLCALVFVLDRTWHTGLFANWKFWAMQLFAAVMVVLFDIYANGFIWSFNPAATIGITLINTPLENMLFGFALIGMTLVLFERSTQQKS